MNDMSGACLDSVPRSFTTEAVTWWLEPTVRLKVGERAFLERLA